MSSTGQIAFFVCLRLVRENYIIVNRENRLETIYKSLSLPDPVFRSKLSCGDKVIAIACGHNALINKRFFKDFF